uniref:Pvc16 N-terminal domain-containing protein n=1 Tax=Candidatus Kentrum sp. SD TaxID=2126332 RepID=A0A451BHT5_9GAMM|nr:MAG: Protein of unknown function (DUF4255) [Candidatus Kentron sp. SD]VFK77806.1 MAG: Protein of unknown function (DUF4255) [Candidatus Kentron sp. SD]
MIDEALIFLKNQVNAHIDPKAGATPGVADDKVVLIDGEKTPVTFQPEAISLLLVNIAEERVLREADPYSRAAGGGSQKVFPDIPLYLYVLFAARFKKYSEGLGHLSSIIGYFQNHRVLDRQNAPTLDSRIEKLVMELVSLPFCEQADMWSGLRSSYRPSVLYKASMVVFRDEDGTPTTRITDKELRKSP